MTRLARTVRGRDRRAMVVGAAGAAVVAALFGVAFTSCGIPVQSTAQPLSVNVPRRIVSPPTSTTIPSAAAIKVDVFFVATGRYVTPEVRYAKASDDLPAAISSLLVGPSPSERIAGVTTALGYTSITLLSWKHAGNVVTLNFSADFGALSGNAERLGVAQVVYTVAGIYRTDGVQFQLDGATIAVPLQDGEHVNGAVHVSQYATLLAPVTPATGATAAGPTTTASRSRGRPLERRFSPSPRPAIAPAAR